MQLKQQQKLIRPYPHLAVALLLMQDKQKYKKDYATDKELTVTIQQVNISTGKITPLKVVL